MIPQKLSHYRVLEKIGAGGMGVVYRAHDEQLERDVAIKVLPPGTLSDEDARRRFRREALALARLNHPNIGGVYEFGTQDGCDFLVMEIVSGPGLEARLAAGPLPEMEVVALGAQLADGLQAAHTQGVVHRDLKPGNMRLTGDGRLKILDFGLAEWVQPGGESAAVTVSRLDHIAGTLPYMAPEQLRGRHLDARTDLYSAGVVLYEMATGKRPYPGSSGPQLITAILESPPSPPTSHNRSISRGLELILMKALEKDPDRRYQSAGELRVDLKKLAGVGLPEPQKNRFWPMAAISALVILALALTAGRLRQTMFSAHPRVVASPVPARRSVAVLGFANLSGKPESAWVSTALSEMFATELAAGDKLRIVPGENVARMKVDLGLGNTDSFNRDTLARIHRLLGSDLVVLGSYVTVRNEAAETIRLDIRLQDTVAGETIASISQSGNQDELLELVSRSGTELRRRLGLGSVSEVEPSLLRASMPANTQSARLYAEGLAKLRTFESAAARDLLQQAILKDPRHAPTHAALASAWSELGYDAKAQAAAKQALSLSGNLSREERLGVEARYYEMLSDWSKSIEIYRSLWAYYPDNLEYALRLASDQTASGKAQDALQTLEDCRRLATAADDARLDLEEARAADSLGNFEQEQTAAENAIKKARSEGNRLVMAQALLRQGRALLKTSDPEKARAAFLEGKDLFFAAGDYRGTGNALVYLGDVLYDKGDFNGARKSYEDALNIFRRIGAQQSQARALNNIGNVLYEQGRLAEAKSYYERTVSIYQDIDSKQGLAGALGNIANILDAMGDLAGARKMQEASLAAFRGVGDKRGTAATLDNLGNVLFELGDLAGARQCYEDALGILEQTSYRRGKSFALAALGSVLIAQGDIASGRKHMEEALAIREELKEEDMVAQSRTQLSGVALEEGRFGDGEALARQAAAQFDQNRSSSNGAWANAVLAKNLLGQQKLPEAHRAADRAVALSLQASDRVPRFEATLAAARVMAASRQTAQSRKQAQSVLAEAGRMGYRPYEFEARLLIAELDLASSRSSVGEASLTRLARDATSSGFLLIAKRASNSLTESTSKARPTLPN
jgi:tetratricopeptide (TPR) repeat protein